MPRSSSALQGARPQEARSLAAGTAGRPEECFAVAMGIGVCSSKYSTHFWHVPGEPGAIVAPFASTSPRGTGTPIRARTLRAAAVAEPLARTYPERYRISRHPDGTCPPQKSCEDVESATVEPPREAILCQRLKGHTAALTAILVLSDTGAYQPLASSAPALDGPNSLCAS